MILLFNKMLKYVNSYAKDQCWMIKKDDYITPTNKSFFFCFIIHKNETPMEKTWLMKNPFTSKCEEYWKYTGQKNHLRDIQLSWYFYNSNHLNKSMVSLLMKNTPLKIPYKNASTYGEVWKDVPNDMSIKFYIKNGQLHFKSE